MLLKKAVLIQKAVIKIKEETGIIAINDFGIHLTYEEFEKHFKSFSIKNRNDINYPYEFLATAEGTKFFCIITEEQYENFKSLDDLIIELESKLKKLKNKKEDLEV